MDKQPFTSCNIQRSTILFKEIDFFLVSTTVANEFFFKKIVHINLAKKIDFAGNLVVKLSQTQAVGNAS